MERERFERRAEAAALAPSSASSPAPGMIAAPGGVEPAQEAREVAGAAPADPPWTREERAAIGRGKAQGAADAGRGWVSDLVGGVAEAGAMAGQAAVVGLETAGETAGAVRGSALGRAVLGSNPLLDLAARAYEGAAALIPDAFADRQAESLAAKGTAFVEGMHDLPGMPAAVVEKFEADLGLADALEGTYLAGRAELSVLEESARVRSQAVSEMGILAAELGATAAAGAGTALKATRALGKLDLGDLPGGTLGALSRAAEAGRSVAADVWAFAADERGGAQLGLGPGERLDRAALDFVRDSALGASRMSAREWMDLREQAKALGAGVERLSEAEFEARVQPSLRADARIPNAGFDRSTGTRRSTRVSTSCSTRASATRSARRPTTG